MKKPVFFNEWIEATKRRRPDLVVIGLYVIILTAFFMFIFAVTAQGAPRKDAPPLVIYQAPTIEIVKRRPRYEPGRHKIAPLESPRLKKKDWKPVNNRRYLDKIARKWEKRAEHDLNYRNPAWKQNQEKQKIWFYSILIGGQMVVNGVDVWYAAQMPI